MYAQIMFVSRLTRHIGQWSAPILCSLMFGLMLGWLLVNLITGCGVQYTDLNGASHLGDCVLVPWKETK
jgi:hypothetical protein